MVPTSAMRRPIWCGDCGVYVIATIVSSARVSAHNASPVARSTRNSYLVVLFSLLFISQEALEILKVNLLKGDVGEESNISCSISPAEAEVQWLFNGEPVKIGDRVKQKDEEQLLEAKDLDGNRKKFKLSNLTLLNATSSDDGNYTCLARLGEKTIERVVPLDLSFPGKILEKTAGPIKLNVSDQANVTMYCLFEVYKPTDVKWWKRGTDNEVSELVAKPAKKVSLKRISSTYEFHIRSPDDMGTYICEVFDPVTSQNITGEIVVMIFAPPQVVIDTVIPISSSQLYLNWTIRAYNSPIKFYNLMYRSMASTDFSLYNREKIGVKNTSFVMEGLDNSTEYQLKLEVTTMHGQSKPHIYESKVKTLDKDPVFVPNITINGFSSTSVTIGWAPPPADIAELIHYYLLEAKKMDEIAPRRAYHSRDNRNLPYMFDNLEPYSTYTFRVCACSDFTKRCGRWSAEMQAATLDGTPGRPSEVSARCDRAWLLLAWRPPLRPNAEIKGYTIELTGNATYKDQYGNINHTTWGPLTIFKTNDTRTHRFDDLQPNMNYTVRLSAVTRTRRRGEEEVRRCATAPAPPAAPPRARWQKIRKNDRYMFAMYLPRVSEKNGSICCYRIFMVRLLPNMDWKSLPSPKDITIIDYAEAHAVRPVLGAYATDVFSNEKFPSESELIMGDKRSVFDTHDPAFARPACRRCVRAPRRAPEPPPAPAAPAAPPTAAPPTAAPPPARDDLFDDDVDTTADPEEAGRERRSFMESDYKKDPIMIDKVIEDDREEFIVGDGLLDPSANYTSFVEIIPGSESDEPIHSDYLNALMPAATPVAPAPITPLEIALLGTCVFGGLVVLTMVVFCVVQTRKSRKMPPHAHVEMNPLHAAFRYVVGHMGGRQQPTGAPPPDMPPIARDALPAAYAQRQADCDYGFQKEFEMLPEYFPERTTHASEARENQPKNRYPDIKAYDQTRVRLSTVDGVPGSDYINANYVMGYKERKQFICAQGPTDTTVNDFWRMVWEHGLELVVMLTNLEEYSKVKCSRYWPDEVRGARAFGQITVHHVAEKRYSDYIVRELKITKQPVNSDGQPIVENNGIAKRNGECGGESAPTSPREAKGEWRLVRQYHFLMWKDFAAPEHPHSILKFIKRVNEAWSTVVGRPAVVHCSAGVGRTGTLVALDCLLEQLRAVGHVTVFNTVAELRRQRNFLVQSLKQYVFVYRALVEYAHYGDTEIPASRLKTAIDRLRNTPEGADKCLMEHEFEKIMEPPVAEAAKSCAAGQADELRARNRAPDCLPYDRNRVILAPVPGRDYSTYINASFIEAYDNSEGFIITQDPLPNTITDFWRMVSEHNVSTIVMLSELGEGKCPRYWDDGVVQYDHISVQYEESESCPYYTRRQFRITNTKSGECSPVRHLQYQGWPTAAGHVPEVTRGLAELAELAAPLDQPPRPLLVHCQYGTERSALFVALCILIWQLRVERRVDVSGVARKMRSQRARTIDTFLQYEFLHRAILNYAELHNLLEDS